MNSEKRESSNSFLDTLQAYHLPAFVGGATLIVFLTALSSGTQNSIGMQLVGEEFITPARIALVGIGTGYYLGDALKQNSTDIVAFHIGAFLALLFGTLRLIPTEPEIFILATAVLFSLSMNLSSLVDSYAGIRESFDLLARDVPRGGIIFIFSVQYIVSFHFWFSPSVNNLSLFQQVIVFLTLIILLFISYSISQFVTGWKKQNGSAPQN